MSDKQLIMDAVQSMPESATISEISETVAILAAIQRGNAALDAGQVLTHEEFCRRVRSFRGSLAHVPGTSDDFLAEKHAEAELDS